MTIAAVLVAAQAAVEGVTGILDVPDNPPEALNVFPAAVCYVASGDVQELAVGPILGGEHVLAIELHVAPRATGLPLAVAAAADYYDSVPTALLTNTALRAAVDRLERLTYTFGALKWGETDTIGFTWRLTFTV